MPVLPFTGADFQVQAVAAAAAAVVRVTFTQDPVAVNALAANDGLNRSNYTITGPVVNAVAAVSVVVGDPLSVDVALVAPLVTGTWTMAVDPAVQSFDPGTSTYRNLQAPLAQSLSIIYNVETNTLNPGSENDDAESVLRKHLNPALAGPVWDAVIAALATGDEWVRTTAAAALAQRWLASAEGLYLERRAAATGIVRSLDLGMDDDSFRALAQQLQSGGVLTHTNLLRLLEIYFGSDSVRAYAESGPGPFELHEGWTLTLVLDGVLTVTAEFADTDFDRPALASADEVAAALNRALTRAGSEARATSHLDPETGLYRVRVSSGSLGQGSSVQILGGIAQSVLQFPEPVLGVYGTAFAGALWFVSNDLYLAQTTLTTTGTLGLDLSPVSVGDYLIFRDMTGPSDGSYEILATTRHYLIPQLIQTLTLALTPEFVGLASMSQTQAQQLQLYRPRVERIQRELNRQVTLSQTQPLRLDLVVPATSGTVARDLDTAAYLPPAQDPVTGTFIRDGDTVTITTASPHGIPAGATAALTDTVPDLIPPAVSPGSYMPPGHGLFGSGTCDKGAMTLISSIGSGAKIQTGAHTHTALASRPDRALVVGGVCGSPEIYSDSWALLTLARVGSDLAYTWTIRSTPGTQITYAAAASVQDSVLVCGGHDEVAGAATTNTWVYTDSIPNTALRFVAGPPLGSARVLASIAVTGSEVLVCGGYTDDNMDVPRASAETSTYTGTGFDSFTATGSMTEPRAESGILTLADGTVLVCGGWAPTASLRGLSTCEIYDPITRTWARTGSMAWTRYVPVLLQLENGRVLVCGGWGHRASDDNAPAGTVAVVEVFDVSTGTWAASATMPPRPGQTAADYGVTGAYRAGSNIVIATTAPDMPFLFLDPVRFQFVGTPAVPTEEASVPISSVALTVGSETVVVTRGGAVAEPDLVLIPGRDSLDCRISGTYAVDAPTPSTLTVTVPDRNCYGSGSVTVTAQAAVPGWTGPYSFDPVAGFNITSTWTTATSLWQAGRTYLTLAVADTTGFPSSGWVCVGYAGENAVAVAYDGISGSELLLKPMAPVAAGTTNVNVVLLASRSGYVPAATDYPLSATNSTAGTAAAIQTLTESVASIDLVTTIVYPGDIGLGGSRPRNSSQISDKIRIWGPGNG